MSRYLPKLFFAKLFFAKLFLTWAFLLFLCVPGSAQLTFRPAQTAPLHGALTFTPSPVSAAAQLAAAKNALASTQSALASAQSQLAGVQATLHITQGSQMALITAESNLQGQVITLNNTVSALTGQVSALQNQVSAAQNSLAAANTTLASDSSTIAADNTAIALLQAQVLAGNSAPAAPQRLAFGHDIPGGSSYQDVGRYYLNPSPGTDFYGSNQPVITVPSTMPRPAQSAIYAQFKAMGVDGISTDEFNNTANLSAYLTAADGAGITFAPCTDNSTILADTQAQINAVDESFCTTYASLAAGHTSAQKCHGKPVVWTYGQSDTSAANWQIVQSATGSAASLFGDVDGMYLNNDGPSQAASVLAGAASVFDEEYSFGAYTGLLASKELAGLIAGGKPFAWTAKPQYYKVVGNAPSGNTITYGDAQGTLAFQTTCQDAITKATAVAPGQCNFLFFSTVNDFGEETETMPSTDWGWTLSDLCQWYAAKFKGTANPFSDVRMYVTIQQSGYLGGTLLAEVSVINPSQKSVTVHAILQNPFSQAATGDFGGSCPPNSLTRFAFTLPLTSAAITQAATGLVPALRISASVADDLTGSTLSSVNSAWSVLHNAAAPTGGGQALYYSLSSTHTSPAQPSGTVNVSSGGVKTLTLTAAPGTTPTILELLHDTRKAFVAYNLSSVPSTVFTDMNVQADNRNDPTDYGSASAYVVREVTADGKILYGGTINVTHN